jgi:hypothetical protein
VLGLAYFTDSGKTDNEYDDFCSLIHDFIKTEIRNRDTIIIGADTNASIGKRSLHYDEGNAAPTIFLGPYGNGHTNPRCETLFEVLHMKGIKDVNSFYNHRRYDMWTRYLHKKSFAIDRFLIRPTWKKIVVVNANAITDRAQSDHLPIIIFLKIKLKRNSKKGRKQKSKDKKRGRNNHDQFEAQLSAAVVKDLPYPEFAETLVETTRILAEIKIEEKPEWFQEIIYTLVPHTQRRNQALARFIQSKNPRDRATLQEHRRHRKIEIRKAKRQWQKGWRNNAVHTTSSMIPKRHASSKDKSSMDSQGTCRKSYQNNSKTQTGQ